MRDFIALCWYVPWLREVCQDRLAVSASSSLLLVAQHVFWQPCGHYQELTTV
jgi:hypothetical protein